MHRALAELLQDAFPAVDPAKARAYLSDLARYTPIRSDLFASAPPAQICQGDILEAISFLEDYGDEYRESSGPGLLLSHSCDVDQGERLVFAACRSFAGYRDHPSQGDIRRNTYFSLFFLGSVPSAGDLVADFNTLQSIDRRYLLEQVRSGSVRRISSFTPYGYYYFIAKLTVHFLRAQSEEEQRGTARPSFLTRLRDVALELPGLAGYLIGGR